MRLSAGESSKPHVGARDLWDDSGNRDHWNRKHEQRIDSAIDTLLEIKNLTAVLLNILSRTGRVFSLIVCLSCRCSMARVGAPV
jgi:hypothetical protein